MNPVKSEPCQLDTTTDYSIVEPEPNLEMPDIKTVEVVSDYKYFQRIEILWDDLTEWI